MDWGWVGGQMEEKWMDRRSIWLVSIDGLMGSLVLVQLMAKIFI
jgi:hypothetical protein